MEKYYHATRHASGCAVTVQAGMNVTELNPRHDLRNHSPEGFNWGYHGSGPAQLALAICADVLADDDRALGIYQWFKRSIIASDQRTSWTRSESEIKTAILALERHHTRGANERKELDEEFDRLLEKADHNPGEESDGSDLDIDHT